MCVCVCVCVFVCLFFCFFFFFFFFFFVFFFVFFCLFFFLLFVFFCFFFVFFVCFVFFFPWTWGIKKTNISRSTKKKTNKAYNTIALPGVFLIVCLKFDLLVCAFCFSLLFVFVLFF